MQLNLLEYGRPSMKSNKITCQALSWVYDAVLQIDHLGENFLLPCSMQSRITKLGRALLIGQNHKLLE
jgi:hypothetical protein